MESRSNPAFGREDMKSFVTSALETMQCSVQEGAAADELIVVIPEGSHLKDVFEDGKVHRLSFSKDGPRGGARSVVQGCQIMEAIAAGLATGMVRHGLVRPGKGPKRKDLIDSYSVFSGEIARASIRRGWRTTVRFHCKIAILGDELKEELIIIEVPPECPTRLMERPIPVEGDIQWVERPPVTRNRLIEMLRRGLRLAERVAMEMAEDCRKEVLERLYGSLERLQRYYQQMGEESLQQGEENALSRYQIEYEKRRSEEVENAVVRAKVSVVALETISVPVKELLLEVEGHRNCVRARALFNALDGTVVVPVRCEACGGETNSIGLTATDEIVCPNCLSECEICGAESVGSNIREGSKCRVCGRSVCEAHAVTCDVCKGRVCSLCVLKCKSGCKVCPECVMNCPKCGDSVVWCKNHTLVNSMGYASCPDHAILCSICGEPYPQGMTCTCSICGQIVCSQCQRVCRRCGRIICSNHVREGRCLKCVSEMERIKEMFQSSLFS